MIIIIKNLLSCGFCHSVGLQSENKSGKIDKYLDLARELR